MPTTRKPRTSSGPLAAGAQKTLTFSTALSKPHSSPALKDKSNATSQSSPVIPTKEIEINPSINDKDVSTEKATVTAGKAKSAEEIKAEKVTDAQVRRYWREREAERKSARVHQEDLSVEEKILRLFDMSSQFGPCIGITRMKRWNRANKLGLQPPIEVLAVLLREEGKENRRIERAYVDELMSNKVGAGDAA